MYKALGLPARDFETNLVIIDGVVHQRLDAFAQAMRSLPGGWRILSICRCLPTFLKDSLYHLIARNRYAIFGRAEACLIPDNSVRNRFAPQGF